MCGLGSVHERLREVNLAVSEVILTPFIDVGTEGARLSFFDEADEPPRTEIRTPSRPTPRRRDSGGSGSGGRRRPPSGPNHQSIVVRRAVVVVAFVVIIVLIAVGINGCQSSARKSALQDYANNVDSVISRSDTTSKSLFKALDGGSGDASMISQSINKTRANAQTVLSDARGFSVPSAARTANSHLLLALQMRLDGITNIANEIQPALGTSVGRDAVNGIAAQMARFYASDVLYKQYTLPALVSALHAGNIAVGGSDGVPVNNGQFLPSLDWLNPGDVASQLGVSLSGGGSSGSSTTLKGLRGDSIGPVSVTGTQLSTGGTNSIPASPPPTFDVSFTNGGNFDETDVSCKVSVTGGGVTGTKVVASVAQGATASCAVTLSAAPPAGTYNVVVTIEKVPGEKNVQNNTSTFPVTFN